MQEDLSLDLNKDLDVSNLDRDKIDSFVEDLSFNFEATNQKMNNCFMLDQSDMSQQNIQDMLNQEIFQTNKQKQKQQNSQLTNQDLQKSGNQKQQQTQMKNHKNQEFIPCNQNEDMGSITEQLRKIDKQSVSPISQPPPYGNQKKQYQNIN